LAANFTGVTLGRMMAEVRVDGQGDQLVPSLPSTRVSVPISIASSLPGIWFRVVSSAQPMEPFTNRD
jgi:hypothetical protein